MKSNKLKKVLAGATAFALMSMVAGQAAAAQLYRFVGNGDYAQASLNDGATCGYVYVARGGTSTSGTYLFYLVYDCASGTVSETGYGMIPNTNLQGDGSGQLKLSTNTSGANFTREVGNGGALAVTWTKTVNYTMKWAGSSQTSYHDSAGYRYVATGTGQVNSASIQGSVLGHLVTAADAEMGKNNSVQLVIERGQ